MNMEIKHVCHAPTSVRLVKEAHRIPVQSANPIEMDSFVSVLKGNMKILTIISATLAVLLALHVNNLEMINA
jgi:hypothetical protein